MRTTILHTVHATAIDVPTPPPPFAAVTPQLVARAFPATPLANIAANLPHVLAARTAAGLTDTPMLLAALGTIRAECEPFLPLTEQPSPRNTSPGGHPFDLYDHHPGLGNQGPPDGARFCGRGFVQLTGRANYAQYAARTGLPLLTQPETAAQPAAAATLLACFLADRAPAIRRALAAADLAHARRLVNGGANGLDRFTSAIHLANPLFQADLAIPGQNPLASPHPTG
jgi:peptidoglycan L-alanyl-D-glutamate endopeptidase CwlK